MMASTYPDLHWDYPSILVILHYAYPLCTILYFTLAIIRSIFTSPTNSQNVRRRVIVWLMVAVLGTYVAEAVNVVLGFLFRGVLSSQDHNVYLGVSAMTWIVEILMIIETRFPVWYPYYGTWSASTAAEAALLACSVVNMGSTQSISGAITVAIRLSRLLLLLMLMLPYLYYTGHEDLNYEPLVPLDGANATEYGTMAVDSKQPDTDLVTYMKGYTVFLPHIWPSHDKKLQFKAALIVLCLLSTNVLNVLIPRQYGEIIDSFNRKGNSIILSTGLANSNEREDRMVLIALCVYLTYKIIYAKLGLQRTKLWEPVEKSSEYALSTWLQSHLMSLTSSFHDTKETGEIHKALRDAKSIIGLAKTVCFELGLVTVYTAVVFVYATAKTVAKRAEPYRAYVNTHRKEWSLGYQGLDNWDTAQLFCNISYEGQRYADAVKNNLHARYECYAYSHTMREWQAYIMWLGYLCGCFLVIYQAEEGTNRAGGFVTFTAFWAQLSAPIQFFGLMYNEFSDRLTDAERILDLLRTQPSITDSADAKSLRFRGGKVKFEGVSFAYKDGKNILEDITFDTLAATTTAFVGESGGGKTTITKLMQRLYDVDSGSILIDDQDIRQVTKNSLNKAIGVLPQDPQFFNESIMDNIRYAKLNASNDEVYEACKAAAIHNKILKFKLGYNTKVGEHGGKLSGGEKQRIALARVFLQKPNIVILDEHTNSVDTETESLIQESVKTLCKSRTVFIIAHRLSTIRRADQIVVIGGGRIIERGSHEELMRSKGKYYSLYLKQSEAQ